MWPTQCIQRTLLLLLFSQDVVSYSLQPHGLQECWSGCHFLLQGIFPTQGSNSNFLLGRWILCHWATWEASLKEHYLFTISIYLWMKTVWQWLLVYENGSLIALQVFVCRPWNKVRENNWFWNHFFSTKKPYIIYSIRIGHSSKCFL